MNPEFQTSEPQGQCPCWKRRWRKGLVFPFRIATKSPARALLGDSIATQQHDYEWLRLSEGACVAALRPSSYRAGPSRSLSFSVRMNTQAIFRLGPSGGAVDPARLLAAILQGSGTGRSLSKVPDAMSA